MPDSEPGARLRELLADLEQKFPPPPAELPLDPEIRALEEGSELWRIYFQGGSHPVPWRLFRSFGPTASRFDHQLEPGSGRRILYAAGDVFTCLAEVFQDSHIIDRTTRSPWLVGFRITRAIALLDLTGTWPTQAGASMAISSGPRPRAQEWSRVIYDAYPQIDGLYYASSMHANLPATALYERAEDALPPSPSFHRPLSDPALLNGLKQAAKRLGYELV